MKRLFVIPALALSIAGIPALVGCDRTVSEDKVQKTNPDGSGVTKTEKTVKESDGDVKKTQEKTVTDSDGDTKKSEKTEVQKAPD